MKYFQAASDCPQAFLNTFIERCAVMGHVWLYDDDPVPGCRPFTHVISLLLPQSVLRRVSRQSAALAMSQGI